MLGKAQRVPNAQVVTQWRRKPDANDSLPAEKPQPSSAAAVVEQSQKERQLVGLRSRRLETPYSKPQRATPVREKSVRVTRASERKGKREADSPPAAGQKKNATTSPAAAIAGTKADLTAQDFVEIFQLFDQDQSGAISAAEVHDALIDASSGTISDEEIAAMVHEFDSNRDGELELDEFTRMMIQLQEHCATTAQGLTAARSALEKQMMHSAATLLNRSRTGAVATGVTSALRAAVPAVLMIALLAAIHLQGSMKQSATAEAAQITPVLLWVALGCALLSTVVFVLILSQHGQKFENSPAEVKEASLLVIAICAMVPLYAFASALKLLLPGDEFAFSRALIEGAKECYEVKNSEAPLSVSILSLC